MLRNLGIILMLLLVLFTKESEAQLYQYGIHAGYNFSKYKVKNERPDEDLLILNGRTKGGPTVGLQFSYGPPRDQEIMGFHIVPSLLAEVSVCQCGGRVSLLRTINDTTKSLTQLEFLNLRVDFSPKFVANLHDLQFLIGPTLTKMFSEELELTRSDDIIDASGFYNPIIIGYEFGFGYKLKALRFSGRFQGHATAFGKETTLLPTALKNSQFRFMIHFFFLQKNRGSYLDTLYW